MRKLRRFGGFGSGLTQQQRSTLELWQDHMAALARSTERRDEESKDAPRFTEQSVATIVDRPSIYR